MFDMVELKMSEVFGNDCLVFIQNTPTGLAVLRALQLSTQWLESGTQKLGVMADTHIQWVVEVTFHTSLIPYEFITSFGSGSSSKRSFTDRQGFPHVITLLQHQFRTLLRKRRSSPWLALQDSFLKGVPTLSGIFVVVSKLFPSRLCPLVIKLRNSCTIEKLMPSRLDYSREAKIEKRQKLEALGVNVHPYSFVRSHNIHDAQQQTGKTVQISGRVLRIREHGKLTFLQLRDDTASLQVVCKQDVLGTQFPVIPLLDVGDFLGVEGVVNPSQSGELSVFAEKVTVLGKSLRPFPATWQGIDDPELRYRKRYLDLLLDPQVKKVLDTRWLVEKEIRRYLQDQQHFTEVETPILQPLYGGTNARPFTTYMNALDCDFYLRIAPELYLKRLIVGGYERIFEIARNFRNEGIDQTHQPEFTMIEWYEAYADYQRMMDVAEGLVRHLVQVVYGKTTLLVGDKTVDVGQPWPRLTMARALAQFADLDVETMSDAQLQAAAQRLNVDIPRSFSRGKAIFALFDQLVTKHLVQPTWIIDYPKEVSPLAKQHRQNKDLVERFEGYIGGKELCDGWSEITDALDQRRRFEVEQQHLREGDAEAQPTDEEFLEAMEYGMPPLGGIGIGVDRLVMFITNTWMIKEVIAFPTLRPLQKITPLSTKTLVKAKVSAPARQNPTSLPTRAQAESLVQQYIQNEALVRHVQFVAQILEDYARELGEDSELWYQTGLLHDLDWEQFPDEHPKKATQEWLSAYPAELRQAISAHAPNRTGVEPTSTLDKYLFAVDELSGLIWATALLRPTKLDGLEARSVVKKIKDKAFARNVSREDIQRGIEMIEKSVEAHITFLVQSMKKILQKPESTKV